MKIVDQINKHQGLFVNYLAQAGDQELVVFFSEARVNKDKSKVMHFNEGTEHEYTLSDIHPIVSDEQCKKYKAVFKRFFIYEVIEESCVSWDEEEVFEGTLIRTFTKSRFLDHIDSHFNIDWYEGAAEMKYGHHQIGGLDFIVNVAAHQPPAIEQVKQFIFQ